MAQRLEFSEFTFGFALVENFTRDNAVKAAPVFPSLREEGKVTGGYDVSLALEVGLPLLLQFKVPRVLSRRSRLAPSGFPTPYYRIELRCRSNEQGFSQHSVLLAHQNLGRDVYYVTPRFHKAAELDALFAAGTVVDESAFITPGDIGPLSDEPHHVAYCRTSDIGWLRSEPLRLPHEVSGDNFRSRIRRRSSEREEARVDFERLLEDMVLAVEAGRGAKEFSNADKPALWGDEQQMVDLERREPFRDTPRMLPREFARLVSQTRPPHAAAATFARLWMGAELLVVDSR